MGAIKDLTVPDLGGATEVVVIELLVKPGDKVKADTSVVTLESDKATMEIPAGDEGVVKQLKVKVGSKVGAGAVLMTLETAGAAATAEKSKPAAESVQTIPAKQASATPQKSASPAPEEEEGDEEQGSGDVHAGPGVRRLAREFGIDLSNLRGTGPKQRVLKEDLQTFVKNKLASSSESSGTFGGLAAAPVIDFTQFGQTEIEELSRIQKISGKNLHRNWISIPHVTQFGEADITDLEAYRQRHKARFEKEKIKLTPLVFIMKAVVDALRQFPQFNASLDPKGENLILKKYFHIGVAVDTPNGLVVPVVRNVDQKRIRVLAQELAQFSEKARNKQLTPGDMQGGCFSISSLGGIGGTAFTPIINAPEVAILGVSKSAQKPIYQDGGFIPRLMLPLSLSYDHRVIDGAQAARFIVYLSELLGDIRHLLL